MRLIADAGADADLDNPTLNFDYRRTGANAELTARGSYNRADVAFFDPLSLIGEAMLSDRVFLFERLEGTATVMLFSVSLVPEAVAS